jgi:glutamyl-tRNA synthetase
LQSYIEEGSIPEAVVNYLCLLGWSPKENREKMPLDEIIRLFDLPQILRHNARFDLNKLRWLDAEYIRDMSEDRFRELGAQALARAGLPVNTTQNSPEYTRAALATCRGKIKRFADLPAYAGFYFTEEVKMDPSAAAKEFTPENRDRLRKFTGALSRLPDFTAPAIEQTLKAVAAELGVKAGILVHPTRLALTGAPAGPSLYHLMEVLGKQRVLKRLAV